LYSNACLNPIQRIEKLAEGTLVGYLAGGKSAAIDAVIDVLIDECIDSVNFFTKLMRLQIDGGILECVECAVQHADNLC